MLHIRKIKRNSETLLFIVGSLLLIISFILFHFEKIVEVDKMLRMAIENEIYLENTKNNIEVEVNVEYLEPENNESKPNNYVPNYMAFLEIEKIGLKQGILPKGNRYNNVNYHVQILDISDMPDVVNGNMILAGHSGNGSIAYFKNLYKLNVGDVASIYYNGKLYKYRITNIYNEVKDGSVNIYRNIDKTTLTLITCTKNDKEHQTIYISELIDISTY